MRRGPEPGRVSQPSAESDLLFAGETLDGAVDAGDARVLVSSHRVLVLADGEGEVPLRTEHRRNVEGASVETTGRTALRDAGLRAAAAGVAALLAGLALDLEVPPVEGTPAGTGLGGLFGLAERLVGALAVLDDALLLGGAVGLLVGVGLLGGYLRTRRRRLVVSVAGREDLRIGAGAGREAAARLDSALTQD
jgi:hypothetical protein